MNTGKVIAAAFIFVMAFAAFAVIPADDVSGDDAKYVEMKGDFTSQLTMTSEQTVVVVDDLNIIDGGQLRIDGDFIVKEGKTVTIEGAGSRLMLYGNAIINGTITSKVTNGLEIKPGYDGEDWKSGEFIATVNGTINALGDASGKTVNSASLVSQLADLDSNPDAKNKAVIINGSVNVGTNAEIFSMKMIVEKGAVFNVLGTVGGSVVNSGTVNFDGHVNCDVVPAFTVYIADAVAEINIVSVTDRLEVCDEKMYAYTFGGVQYYIGSVPEYIHKQSGGVTVADIANGPIDNRIMLCDITNVKVTETIISELDDGDMTAKTQMNIIPIDSSKAVGKVDASISNGSFIAVPNGETVCLGSMIIDQVTIEVVSAATVVGDITYLQRNVDPSNPTYRFNVYGTLTVDGSVIMKSGQDIACSGTINAAKYIVKSEDNSVDTYYTALPNAIYADVKDITLLGQIIIKEDVKVPVGTKITTSVNINGEYGDDVSAVIIEDGATFTLVNGAQFDQKGDVHVKGAFVIENMNYGIRFNDNKIYADVKLKDGACFTYTNIYKAFAQTVSGDELCPYNPYDGQITIDKDLTLPTGVIFNNFGEVGSTPEKCYKYMEVKNGVTFTIDGTLQVCQDMQLYAEENDSFEDHVPNWSSKTTIVYGGEVYLCSVLAFGSHGSVEFQARCGGLYDMAVITGAYYCTMDPDDGYKYVVSGIEMGLSRVSEADQGTVYLLGDIRLENISFSGEEDNPVCVVCIQGKVETKVTMNNFTFDYGTFMINPEITITGDIGTANGKLTFNDALVKEQPNMTDYSKSALFWTDYSDGEKCFMYWGCFQSSNETVASGTVYSYYVNYSSVYPESTPDTMDFKNMRFTVEAGSTYYLYSDNTFSDTEFCVLGDVVVMNYGSVIGSGESVATILGTMTAEKKDGHSGYVSFPRYSVGLSDTDASYIGVHGTAVLAGSGSFDTTGIMVIVKNGASIIADVIVDFMESSDSTEYYIDGRLWATAYVAEGADVDISALEPVLDDACFEGWQTYDERSKKYMDIPGGTLIGAAGFKEVYADISRNIYEVRIIADIGIDNIYIDGKVILKDKTSNTFIDKVSAGSHTISYTLANGYSGNAVITAIDGKIVSGSSLMFVINDERAGTDMKMEITVSGIEKSGYDTDPETHDEGTTGLTTTEILLIVAVFIMAVMAVVLILRLNRN